MATRLDQTAPQAIAPAPAARGAAPVEWSAPSRCPKCQLNGAHRWLEVPGDWRRPEVRERYFLAWCPACDLGFLTPRPGQDQIAAYYSPRDYYTHFAQPPESIPPRRFGERLRTAIAWRLDRGLDLDASEVLRRLGGRPAKDARICELGCGSGALLAELRTAGCITQGIEPDPSALAVARAAGLDVQAGRAEEATSYLPESAFDVVIMSHVLEHCLEPIAAVRAAAAILKPGGVLLCETPNNAAIGLRRAGAAWYWLDVPRHLNFFTGASLRGMVELADLKVEATDYCGFTRQFGPTWIDFERKITRFLGERHGTNPRPDRASPGEAQAWWLLARSLFGRSGRRYDSVRIVARRAAQ